MLAQGVISHFVIQQLLQILPKSQNITKHILQ